METYPLSLALFDFLPVTIFLIGSWFLVKTVRSWRGSACSRMAMAAGLLIFLGGFLKASWKILYAGFSADLRWMSEVQFVLLAPGFFALLMTAIYTGRSPEKSLSPNLPLLAMAGWKVPLLVLMTLSSMGAQGILAYISFRRGLRWAATGFIIAFLGLVAMGALASGEQNVTRQWLEEGINTTAQIGFAIGSFLLYRSGSSSHG